MWRISNGHTVRPLCPSVGLSVAAALPVTDEPLNYATSARNAVVRSSSVLRAPATNGRRRYAHLLALDASRRQSRRHGDGWSENY